MMLREVLLAVAAILAAGLVIYGAIEARSLRVTRLEIRTPGLPAAFDRFTIMHVSDLHYRRGRSFPTLVETAMVLTGRRAAASRGATSDLTLVMARFEAAVLPYVERLEEFQSALATRADIVAVTLEKTLQRKLAQ